jgi:hypothetical protein
MGTSPPQAVRSNAGVSLTAWILSEGLFTARHTAIMKLAVTAPMRLVSISISALSVLALVACRSTRTRESPRYLVTAAPLDVGLDARGLCVAIDPTNPRGIWWWEPGRSGCSSRSTGPGVFQGDDATVATHGRSATIHAHFRMPLTGRPDSTMPDFANVNVTLQNGYMQSRPSGTHVLIEPWSNLDVPERQ